MSAAEFDQISGRLVLSRSMLVAAGDVAAGRKPDQTAFADLTSAGVLAADGTLAPSVASTALTVAGPRLSATLATIGRAGAAESDLWVGDAVAVMHRALANDGSAPVVSGVVALVPGMVAAALRIGPRPMAVASPFTASPQAIRAALRAERPPPWPEVSLDAVRLWRVTWRTVHGEQGQFAALDLGEGGLWRPVNASADGLQWEPTDSSAVWTSIAELHAAALVDHPLPV